MEKFVEINSSGKVILDKEILSMLEPKGNRLKCVFDRFKILLIPEETASNQVSLEATLKRLELEHKERICQGNLREGFEKLVQRGRALIAQSNMEWQEPEEIVRKIREKREMNIMESLGYEK